MKELGELIRSARQRRGITLDQAAADTRIRLQYLEALEDGEPRLFPGPAYVAGFLRNYGTYLGLNADEVLQTYHALTPPAHISVQPATTVGVERLRRRSRRRLTWVFGAIVTAILMAVAVQRYDSQQTALAGVPRLPIATSGLVGNGGTGKMASVGVKSSHKTWVFVRVNGQRKFWGQLRPGHFRQWHGRSVSLGAHRASQLRVWADGKYLGKLSHSNAPTKLKATPTHVHRQP